MSRSQRGQHGIGFLNRSNQRIHFGPCRRIGGKVSSFGGLMMAACRHVVVVSHNPDFARAMDRIIRLHEGRIEEP